MSEATKVLTSKVTHNGPTCGLVAHWLGRVWTRISGWQVVGEVPSGHKFVLIGAPHTSNWDFIHGLAAVSVFRLKISWMGKDSLFKPPFGWIMKWLGGIPINRAVQSSVVEQTARKLSDSDRLVILITPSATRAKKEYWKSGFYWIAKSAKVPILCGYLDYARKQACIGFSLLPSEDIKRDMDRIRAFYQEAKGKYPECMTIVRLKDEDQ